MTSLCTTSTFEVVVVVTWLCYYNTGGNYATIEDDDRARMIIRLSKYEVLGSEYLYLVFLSSAY